MQTFRESGELNFVTRIAALQDKTSFKELHWEGTFEDYLDIVVRDPEVTRTAYQRALRHDPVARHRGVSSTTRRSCIRYKFFDDPIDNGDATRSSASTGR